MTKFISVTLCCLGLLLAGCATHQGKIETARAGLMSGNCETALPQLEKLSAEDGDNQLLYLMEYGSALQICKDYQKSNEVFLKADRLSEQIDYHSVSRIVGATLLNEEMIQYKGDIFERLFINVSAALNFLELGKLDEAMVEVRRIHEKYNRFTAEEKNSFELNSFAQYLAGMIYEADGEFDDACIAYQSSYKLDKTYRNVGLDMLSACWRARRYQEYERLAKEMSLLDSEIDYVKRKNKNEVMIVFLQGLGPRKTMRGGSGALPYLSPTYNVTRQIVANYEDPKKKPQSQTSRSVYSVQDAAIATLEADYNALAIRRLGARVAKEVVADQIRQKDEALGNVALLVMLLAERADLRNWSLLPEGVQVLRLNPKAGTTIELTGLSHDHIRTEDMGTIDLSLNPKKRIYLLRSIR